MSRELTVEIEGLAVERVRAELAVAPLFAGERPLRGAAGRVDWRLCGKLSALVAGGRLRGEPHEATLLATFGGLRVPLLLVLGAGERAQFGVDRFEAFTRDAVARALALRVAGVALPFPDELGTAPSVERRAAALLMGAAGAMAEVPDPAALQVRVLVAREEATHMSELLRRVRPARFPQGVALRLPGRRRAQAAASPPPRGTQLVK